MGKSNSSSPNLPISLPPHLLTQMKATQTMNDTPLLIYDNVSVRYANGVQAVRGVSFALAAGECLALVGESGCGKTTLARAVLGLLPATATVSGSIQFQGRELVGADEATLRRLRGLMVGLVAQDPFAACNPLTSIFTHVAEAWRSHRLPAPAETIVERLRGLGIPNAASNAQRYPHQWSGGMLQRATIAAAAAHHPPLIVADEPTSALDADRADATLRTLRELGAAILLVSHDIGVVARHADRIAVCYAGQIVELQSAARLRQTPRHPYTIGLFKALPNEAGRLPEPLPGAPPRLTGELRGCAFAPRCQYVEAACHEQTPPLIDGLACPITMSAESNVQSPGPNVKRQTSLIYRPPSTAPRQSTVVEACGVSKVYGQGVHQILAVEQADLTVQRGEIVGISGASGCGKSTLLRLLATIETPSHGEVWLNGVQVAAHGRRTGAVRGGFVMPIFQDPQGSLDRRWPVWRSLTEPLTAPQRPRLAKSELRRLAREQLAAVGLSHVDPDARPGELSVGQCQRIAIARALIAEPALIVADEPTSALDASVSASILHLLAGIAQRNTALIIVSHDRPLLDALCDRVLTMRDGVLKI